MGSSTYITLDLPLRVDAAEAETIVREALSTMPWEQDSVGFVMTIDRDLPFLMHSGTVDDLGDGPDGLCFADGRFQTELCITNLWAEVGSDFVDGAEIRDTRLRIDVLFSALERMTDARPGDILGGIRHEESEHLGPIFMTEGSISSSSSKTLGDMGDEAWSEMLKHPESAIRRIPVEAVMGPCMSNPREREIDRALLRSRRSVVIDGSLKRAVAGVRKLR